MNLYASYKSIKLYKTKIESLCKIVKHLSPHFIDWGKTQREKETGRQNRFDRIVSIGLSIQSSSNPPK